MADTPTEREAVGTSWANLHRRKVAQWGLAYAAVAWTLLQVLEYLAETYGWPPAMRQIAVPTLALGSLFALVLAWYHGDRGDQKVSRPEVAILGALLALSAGALWWYGSRIDESAWTIGPAAEVAGRTVPTDAPSVAVLPFVNMSSDPEQEYFSDGLSEEILNALARTPGLYVPARTSSFQFKGKSGDVAKFAATLGVAHVLEGSVRKAGSRVRITAQLIKADDGYHVWSQTYDRELQDILAIQTEISDAIAEALKIRLTTRQKLANVQVAPTSNIDAYEAYLLGRFELNKRGQDVSASIPHFDRAIALDPGFAAARADRALALLFAAEQRVEILDAERWSTVLQQALASVDEALGLDDESPEVLAVAGFVNFRDAIYHLYSEQSQPALRRALEYLDRSLARRPNNGEALLWRRLVLEELERFDDVVAASYDSVKRDPLSFIALTNHFSLLLNLGRRSEAESVMERLRSLNIMAAQGDLTELARYDGDRLGRIRALLGAMDLGEKSWSVTEPLAAEFAAFDLRAELRIVLPGWQADSLLGDCAKALPAARQAHADHALHPFELAYLLTCVGQYDEAARLYLSVWNHGLAVPNWLGRSRALVRSAYAARRAGLEYDAQAVRDHAARILSGVARAGYTTRGDRALEWAYLLAYDGQPETAGDYLKLAVRTGLEAIHWREAQRDPLFGEVMSRADVQAALREQEEKLTRQRAEVVRMLCGPAPVSTTYKPAPETCAEEPR